ncbi:hypothetical protein [Rhizosphaericola mali]|uniref:Uncharacterized protein n=1 Tax=Rhizosphaericola mali TaxID=2545455 RepID=A0A5P2G6H3_9BACT|nr:hypothetical protein [Rhizosphaericola mali]QES88823.1 hypothetical protein E0W69_009210 [Rhizosphaericola mali]
MESLIIFQYKYDHNVDAAIVGHRNYKAYVPVIATLKCNMDFPELSIGYVNTIDTTELELSDEQMCQLHNDVLFSAIDMAQTSAVDLAMAMSPSKMIVNSVGNLIELHA